LLLSLISILLAHHAYAPPIKAHDAVFSKGVPAHAVSLGAGVVSMPFLGLYSVFLGCPWPQMVRVTAGRVVALVEDIHPIRNLSLPKLVCDPVCALVHASVADVAVAKPLAESLIDPTARKRIYQTLRLEPLTIFIVGDLLAVIPTIAAGRSRFTFCCSHKLRRTTG